MSDYNNTHLAFVPAIAPALKGGQQLVRGLVSILHFTHSDSIVTQTDPQDVMDKINGRSRVVIATDKTDDTRVLKVKEAIKCVEEFLNGDVVKDILLAILKGQVFDDIGPINGAFDVFAASLTKCIRGKALQQKRDRRSCRVTPTNGRPGRPKGAKNGSRSPRPSRIRGGLGSKS